MGGSENGLGVIGFVFEDEKVLATGPKPVFLQESGAAEFVELADSRTDAFRVADVAVRDSGSSLSVKLTISHSRQFVQYSHATALCEEDHPRPALAAT